MINEQEKLSKFIEAVNDEIDTQIEQILKEAEEEKEVIISAAIENSDATVKGQLSARTKKAENKFAREISAAEFSAKKEVLIYRDELIEKVFSSVAEKLLAYKNSDDYVDTLVKKIVMLSIEEEAEIMLSPADMKYADILAKAVKSEKVKFIADDNIKIGGVSVYLINSGIIIDKTFDLALEEQKSIFVSSNAFAD